MRYVILSALTITITIFWDMTPCSLVGRYYCFGRTCCLYLQDNLKVEAKVSSEMLVPVCQITMCHILKHCNLNIPYCKILKPHIESSTVYTFTTYYKITYGAENFIRSS
jgi:hypothetical protein